jgi:hypothetical protein
MALYSMRKYWLLAIAIIIIGGVLASLKIWQCHDGFGGASERHCHAAWVREHDH